MKNLYGVITVIIVAIIVSFMMMKANNADINVTSGSFITYLEAIELIENNDQIFIVLLDKEDTSYDDFYQTVKTIVDQNNVNAYFVQVQFKDTVEQEFGGTFVNKSSIQYYKDGELKGKIESGKSREEYIKFFELPFSLDQDNKTFQEMTINGLTYKIEKMVLADKINDKYNNDYPWIVVFISVKNNDDTVHEVEIENLIRIIDKNGNTIIDNYNIGTIEKIGLHPKLKPSETTNLIMVYALYKLNVNIEDLRIVVKKWLPLIDDGNQIIKVEELPHVSFVSIDLHNKN